MGKPILSVRLLFLVFAGVVIVVAVVGYRHYFRMTRDILPVSRWPRELEELVAELRRKGTNVGDVDVRARGYFVTYYWRMPASEQVIAAHVDGFHLVQVANNGIEVDRVREHFPPAWTWPELNNVKCFAYPPELPSVHDGGFECALMHDTTGNELFCLYYEAF